MKRIIIVVLLIAMLICSLAGCGTTPAEEAEAATAPMFVKVEDAYNWIVVYHRETKVMYVVSDSSYNYGSFTLLVNADGTPMIWEGEK